MVESLCSIKILVDAKKYVFYFSIVVDFNDFFIRTLIRGLPIAVKNDLIIILR